MCPNSFRWKLATTKQAGFLMPLALFILVGLGALALAISRLSSGQFSSAVQETISVQAFYAAESASQLAMNRILFNATSKADADLNCAAVNGSRLNYSAPGLNNCSAQLACTAIANAGETAGIYRIESVASCGGGMLIGERRLVTAVRYE
jgi:MSHA biogenesis protein MshP